MFEPYAMSRVVPACFKSGRTSVEDDPRSGRPSTSMDDDHFKKVLAVIRQNRRLVVGEVAEEVGIFKSSCNLILTDIYKLPHLLLLLPSLTLHIRALRLSHISLLK